MNWVELPWGKQLYLLCRVVCGLYEVCSHFTYEETQTQLGEISLFAASCFCFTGPHTAQGLT